MNSMALGIEARSMQIRRWGRAVPAHRSSCTHITKRPHRYIAVQATNERGTQETMDALDSMLGTTDTEGEATDADQGPDSTPQLWWQVRPSQSEPPRRTAMSSGGSGRFINEDVIKSDVRAGRVTDIGEALDIPKVEPVISYLLLATNLAVHAFGISLALTQSDVASNDFFLSLANDPAKVAAGETWRLLSSTFLHAGLLHLGLNCWALGVVAPEAEAVLGYTTFAYVYLASGLAGSVLNLYGSGTVAVGASGAICGCLGALLGYFLRNPSLERSGKQVLFILAVAGANLILGTDPDAMIDNLGHVGGLVAGTWLGYSMGPRFMMSREVDIPEGAMFVPEDAKEVAVVIDQSSGLGRLAVGLSFAASLGVAAAAGIALQNGA